MATQFVQQQPRFGVQERRGEVRTAEVAVTGAAAETIGAAAAIVLAIIGLAGGIPAAMMAVATIVLGGAILLDALAVGARYEGLVREASSTGERLTDLELGGGMSAGVAAGIAGIVLGILAVIGVTVASSLCAVALMGFGAALVVGSAEKSRLVSLRATASGLDESARRAIDEATGAIGDADVLVGIGAIALGILALAGLSPVVLVLVGALAVGGAVLMSGSAFGARTLRVLRHAR